jgi:hypothetical protein
MQADRRTDMTKLTLAFRNFAKAPKKERKHASNTEKRKKESGRKEILHSSGI